MPGISFAVSILRFHTDAVLEAKAEVKPRFSTNRRFLRRRIIDAHPVGFFKRIEYTAMPYKTWNTSTWLSVEDPAGMAHPALVLV